MKKPLEPTLPHQCRMVAAGAQVHPISDYEERGNPQPQGKPTGSLTAFGNCVRSLREAAAAAGISIATLRRRVADGTGPVIVRMSPRRVGVRDSDFVAWLDGCANSRSTVQAPSDTGGGQR
jgi:predicted DNA-binding transcriptional regulator AlpA